MYFGEVLENQEMSYTHYRKCVLTFMYPRDQYLAMTFWDEDSILVRILSYSEASYKLQRIGCTRA